MSHLSINSQGTLQKAANEFALSAGQQAIWSMYQMAPKSGMYNLSSAMRLRMNLDISAFQRALQKLVDRHAALRTTFTLTQAKTLQRVWPQQDVFFQHEDATTWSADDVQQQMAIEADRSFDLEQGPLLRTYIFTCAQDEHILFLTTHHIVSDFWSFLTLVHELGALYEMEQSGETTHLPPLDSDYADYVRWHAALMSGPQGEEMSAYWQKQLDAAPPVLNLPTDRPRSPIQTYRGGAQSCIVDSALVDQLTALGRSHQNATLYTTLLATFQVLLHRYTGQDDLWIGSPVSGRSQAAFSGLLGYFSNQIVLRARITGDPSFVEFLAQTHQSVHEALTHQHYPFSTLVQHIHQEHDSSRSALFQAAFVFLHPDLLGRVEGSALIMGVDGVAMRVGGLRLEALAPDEPIAQSDLSLILGDVNGKLTAQLRYNADLFDAVTISRMLEHWQTLLKSIVAYPNQPISHLSLLTEATRQQMLVDWNKTEREYAQGQCVHALFEAQAARLPDAVAVIGRLNLVSGEMGAISYQELNGRANQLARHLRSLGLKAEDRVGLCMERGVDVMTGFWGIMKAGGAYVPIDPQYPQERKQFILQDTQASVLLTQASLRDSFDSMGARLICLDADWPLVAQQSTENLPTVAYADSPAYLIYTSGSTGEPKGVMITHANLVPYIQAIQTVMKITEQDRQLLSQSFSFSASARQFMVPLSSGAAVVIANSEQVHDPVALFELMKEQGVTIWGVTPSSWRNCIDVLLGVSPEKRRLLLQNKLRLIMSSGEPMSPEIPQAWTHELGHKAQPVNMFGMTEVSGIVTAYPIPSESNDQRNVPVGHPISNAKIYLLDQNLQPVPVGLPGEVYVGGSYLARGYHNRPALTAERFVPNPFATVDSTLSTGHRLYKTGDLARWLLDGNIEFLERTDYQIKIRGFRIELGEVEAVLTRHPLIRQAVVMGQEKNSTSEQSSGDKQLVAYIVADPSGLPTQAELRAFTKEQLPEYMVPSAFVLLEKLPLTATGKVNRRALPQADSSHLSVDADGYAAPRNPLEEVLARMWADLLGVERVGVYDNFFELGGHSLLAIQAMAYLQEVLNVDEPLIAVFFENPTVAGVCEALLQGNSGQDEILQIAETLNLMAGLSEEEMDAILNDADNNDLGALGAAR